MTCNDTIILFTPKGRQVPLKCGRTGFHGELVLCNRCESKRHAIRVNSDEPEDYGFTDY